MVDFRLLAWCFPCFSPLLLRENGVRGAFCRFFGLQEMKESAQAPRKQEDLSFLAKWLLPPEVWLVGVFNLHPSSLTPFNLVGGEGKTHWKSPRVSFPLLLAWILTWLLSAEEPGCPSSTNEATFLLGVNSTFRPLCPTYLFVSLGIM